MNPPFQKSCIHIRPCDQCRALVRYSLPKKTVRVRSYSHFSAFTVIFLHFQSRVFPRNMLLTCTASKFMVKRICYPSNVSNCIQLSLGDTELHSIFQMVVTINISRSSYAHTRIADNDHVVSTYHARSKCCGKPLSVSNVTASICRAVVCKDYMPLFASVRAISR